jgi:multidrug efflux system membrane fusion protein
MRRMNFKASKTVLALALGVCLLTACKPQTVAVASEVIRPVKTITVGEATYQPSASFSAEIKPRIESQLAFRVGGKVVERMVEIGQSVRKDQPLLRLDPVDLQLSSNAAQAQVAAAKATADVAQAALKRAQELAQQNFISAGALDQAVGQASSANAALLAAQANGALGLNAAQYGVLKADSDGVVTALVAEVGQVVAAGTPVIRMAAGSEKDVVFNVSDSALGRTKRGASISVQLWSKPDAALTATVRDVSAMADTQTRTYAIKASLKDPSNLAQLGSTATAKFVGMAAAPHTKTATNTPINTPLSIPLSAVIESQGSTAVWVVHSGAVKKQAVTLNTGAGAPDGFTLVSSGLASGAVVVIAGVHALSEGQKVKLLPETIQR